MILSPCKLSLILANNKVVLPFVTVKKKPFIIEWFVGRIIVIVSDSLRERLIIFPENDWVNENPTPFSGGRCFIQEDMLSSSDNTCNVCLPCHWVGVLPLAAGKTR
jgi:hypothetical protein